MLGELPEGVLVSMRGEPAPVDVKRQEREDVSPVGRIMKAYIARSPRLVGKSWCAFVNSLRPMQVGDPLYVETSAGRLAAIVEEVVCQRVGVDGGPGYRSDVVTRLVDVDAMRGLLESIDCTGELETLRLRTLLFRLPRVDVRAARIEPTRRSAGVESEEQEQINRRTMNDLKNRALELNGRRARVRMNNGWVGVGVLYDVILSNDLEIRLDYGADNRKLMRLADGNGIAEIESVDDSVPSGVERTVDGRDLRYPAPPMLGLRCMPGDKVAITMRDGHRVVGRLQTRHVCSDGSFTVELLCRAGICVKRSHVPDGQHDALMPENITAIEHARGDEEFGWSRPSKSYSLDGCQTGRTSAAKADGGWIEVTTAEQAKALDGKLVEIDAKEVDAAWDTSNLHGQLKQCAWDTRTLRAGAHGPVLWGHFRPMGLRLRVVEKPSKHPSVLCPAEPYVLDGGVGMRNPCAEIGLGLRPTFMPCERCCNTGILRGFTSDDRPCDAPGCATRKLAAKSEGPKEWAVVHRRELLSEGVDGAELNGVCWSATYEHVVVQKDEQRIGFIVADFSEGPGRASGTAAVQLRGDRREAIELTVEAVRRAWNGGKSIHPVAVHGERCRDMVVDRLVCGLRDGSIEV